MFGYMNLMIIELLLMKLHFHDMYKYTVNCAQIDELCNVVVDLRLNS